VSLYGEHSPTQLRDAVARARAAGVLVVAAAGNEAKTTPEYPAAFPETLSVAAATSAGTLASFSSYGPWVKIAAPDCAPVTVLGDGTLVACGTSVSTPLAAGIVALLRTQAPFASADELERALTETARPVPGTQFGLVDAAAALRAVGNPAPRLLPAIVGEAVAREELEAFTGIWSEAGVAATYRWERCDGDSCAAIADATNRTYTVTSADTGSQLRVVVSAPGLEPAASARTTAVAVPPRLLKRPSIVGRSRAGTRLRARAGAWEGTDLKLAVNWQRCKRGFCDQVATAPSYKVRSRDRGYRLKVEVVPSNAVGRASAFSKLTRVVP
jgi:Subtilase family